MHDAVCRQYNKLWSNKNKKGIAGNLVIHLPCTVRVGGALVDCKIIKETTAQFYVLNDLKSNSVRICQRSLKDPLYAYNRALIIILKRVIFAGNLS